MQWEFSSYWFTSFAASPDPQATSRTWASPRFPQKWSFRKSTASCGCSVLHGLQILSTWSNEKNTYKKLQRFPFVCWDFGCTVLWKWNLCFYTVNCHTVFQQERLLLSCDLLWRQTEIKNIIIFISSHVLLSSLSVSSLALFPVGRLSLSPHLSYDEFTFTHMALRVSSRNQIWWWIIFAVQQVSCATQSLGFNGSIFCYNETLLWIDPPSSGLSNPRVI